MPRPTIAEIEERSKEGGIPGGTVAYLNPKNEVPIEPLVFGTTDRHSKNPHVLVTTDTVFGVASLSKPVFSYLVLRLIADEKLTNDDGSKVFGLDSPISEILPTDEKKLRQFFEQVFNPDNKPDRTVSDAFIERAKQLTPRMVLSHTTGIPINGAPRLDFDPGTQYAYGNAALHYLQKAIEHKTEKTLDILAQKEVFTPLKMEHTTYLPPVKDYQFLTVSLNPKELTSKELFELCEGKPSYVLFDSQVYYIDQALDLVKEIPQFKGEKKDLDAIFPSVLDKPVMASKQDLTALNSLTGHPYPHNITPQPSAANSVHTTASDYARLMDAWMSDPNETMQEAFRPQISLTEDQWAIDIIGDAEEDKQDRQQLAWGLCFGLQLDETDKTKVTTAFHSGDMNQWRGWVAMDMNNKTAVVYLANGDDVLNESPHGYGHVLADIIVGPEVDLSHGLNWFFKKFGISRDIEPGWKEKETADTAQIETYVRKCINSPPMPLKETREESSLDTSQGTKSGISRDVEPGWKEKETADTAQTGVYVDNCIDSPPMPLKETTEQSSLETSRETMKKYTSSLKELKSNDPTHTGPIQDSSSEDKKTLSPFQITLKPNGEH